MEASYYSCLESNQCCKQLGWSSFVIMSFICISMYVTNMTKFLSFTEDIRQQSSVNDPVVISHLVPNTNL